MRPRRIHAEIDIAAVQLRGREWLILGSQPDGATAPIGIADMAPDIPHVLSIRGHGSTEPIQFSKPTSMVSAALRAKGTRGYKPPPWGSIHPPTVALSMRVLSLEPGVTPILSGGQSGVIWLSDPGVTLLLRRLHHGAAANCAESLDALSSISRACIASLSMDPFYARS